MTTCHSVEEVRAAARADHDGPLTQDQADQVAVILATVQARDPAA